MNMTQQGFDINRLRQEAHVRWLKPSEVFFILKNHEMFQLANEPPTKPPSGSLFLFNKRILRFFRKDGHLWRRKRDGRTIGEAHERLKVGSVDALNCYYAHGEQNPYFQRRVYWMLDSAYEHIVLVHYREVAEGRYTSSISNMSAESTPTSDNVCSDVQKTVSGYTSRSSDSYEPRESPCSVLSHEEVSSPYAKDHGSLLQPEVNHALIKLKMQLSLDDDDTKTYFGENLPPYINESEGPENQELLGHEPRNHAEESFENLLAQSGFNVEDDNVEDARNFKGNDAAKPTETCYGHSGAKKEHVSWKDLLEMSSYSAGYPNGITSDYLALNDVDKTSTFKIEDISGSDTTDYLLATSPKGLVSGASYAAHNATAKANGSEMSKSDMYIQLSQARKFLLGSESSDNPLESPTLMSELPEVVKRSYCSPETCIAEGSSGLTMDALGMWFDQSQYQNYPVTESSLNIAHKQRFSIHEISPEWASAYESTKVLIVGDILCDASAVRWAVMFGDTEVPLEIVKTGVFRCHTPQCAAGKVSLCITSGNREPCSQMREFEFRANHNMAGHLDNSMEAEANKNAEMLLIVRFAHLLLCGYDSRSNLTGAEPQNYINSKPTSYQWQLFIEALREGSQNQSVAMDWVLQELLKDKLNQWLSSKCLGESTGTDCLLSKQEQGIIHIISGLGYEWALAPILDYGVGVNFRDGSGWTALHWAACFGREKMIAALLAAGASAGAVTDPTSQDPAGKTPASLAALNGHKGLAGYLSEAALTSHLSSLVFEESEPSKGSAALEAEKAVESISQRTIQTHGGTEDQLSLKDSLAAVRNAAQAAARIQAAFRAHSFRKRQQNAALSHDECGLTPDEINELSAAYKFYSNATGSRDKNLDKAALSIQKKYKGWKGRKEFLNFRQNVVKIQAHVRGHQVRKNYKVASIVSVLEKVILRWRRKGVGLRGYRAEPEIIDSNCRVDAEEEDIVKVFRKTKVSAALDEALSRVLSMVDSPEARQQYRRMLECYREAKTGSTSVDEAMFRSLDDLEFIGNYDFGML